MHCGAQLHLCKQNRLTRHYNYSALLSEVQKRCVNTMGQLFSYLLLEMNRSRARLLKIKYCTIV